MGKIFNLTQHSATPEQLAAGVVEPDSATKERIQRLLTFEEVSDENDRWQRAILLADMAAAAGFTSALIGGAPWFMRAMENACRTCGVTPLYSFSKRESVDQPQPDGSVKKVAVFRHVGFIEADKD